MYPVSVLVPCYNERRERIQATCHSALAAMTDDIVLVDDGSAATPEVPAYVRHYSHDSNRGIAAALNTALSHAKHDHICWLSVGDTMHHDKLRQQLELGAPASFHDYRDAVTGAERIAAADWQQRVWHDNQFCGSTTMVHRDVLDAIGGWDESLSYSVDWAFALAIEKHVGWAYLPGVLGRSAEYPGGHTDRAHRDDKHRDHARVSRWANTYRKLHMRHS